MVVAGRTTAVEQLLPHQYYGWEITYFPINFNSTGDNGNAGKIFSQLYFRQAMQTLDRPARHHQEDLQGLRGCDVRPDPARAHDPTSHRRRRPTRTPTTRPRPRQLLSSTGGRSSPTAPTPARTRDRLGRVRGGHPEGDAQLDFNLQFATGITTQTDAVNVEIASWELGRHQGESSRRRTFDTVDRQRHRLHPGAELHLGDPGLGGRLDIRPRLSTPPVRSSSPPARSRTTGATRRHGDALIKAHRLLQRHARQVRELPGEAAAGDLPARPGAVPDGDPEQPARGHPAEPALDIDSGDLVLRQVASDAGGQAGDATHHAPVSGSHGVGALALACAADDRFHRPPGPARRIVVVVGVILLIVLFSPTSSPAGAARAALGPRPLRPQIAALQPGQRLQPAAVAPVLAATLKGLVRHHNLGYSYHYNQGVTNVIGELSAEDARARRDLDAPRPHRRDPARDPPGGPAQQARSTTSSPAPRSSSTRCRRSCSALLILVLRDRLPRLPGRGAPGRRPSAGSSPSPGRSSCP